MAKKTYSIELTEYEYSVLSKNTMISMLCDTYLETATKHNDQIFLSLTLAELEDLTGYTAAEANHAKSRRQEEDLGAICDYLESEVYSIKRGLYEE